MEVINRFKGLDLIVRVPGELWMEVHNIVQEAVIKTIAKKMHWSKQTPSSHNTREDSTHGHHQMVNTKIRLIIFFAAEDE